MTHSDAATAPPRGRFLVVLDADSTLLQNEAIELLAAEAGSLGEVERITTQAMRGELDFAASLRARVSTLRGLDSPALDRAREQITPTSGARELVDAVHAAGGLIGVVSGGFHELLDATADRLGLDFCLANRLAVADGRLTGEVDGPIVTATTKADSLTAWATAADIPLHRTLAAGDGANDLEMMAVAGIGVAFNAKPVVRERADVVAQEVDLRALLPLLGIPRDSL